MFTTHELLSLWSNDQKRREFIKNYKVWGWWFSQPELNLTYYKYDLPGGGRIIAMEYLREPYTSERYKCREGFIKCENFYLQRGDYFNPSASSDHEIAEHLKHLKIVLAKELKS